MLSDPDRPAIGAVYRSEGTRGQCGKQGRNADAAWVKRAFEEGWKHADTQLTLEGF